MWSVKTPVTEEHIECSLTRTPVVYLESIPRQKIELLMDAYLHQEWLAYLVGSISEKGNIFVEDIDVPPHKEASGASAEAEPLHKPDGCVGIIHSHHSMGAFHSGTDQAYVDKSYPTSITVASRGGTIEFDAVCYVVTPCGKASTGKSQVKYVQPKPAFDIEAFLKVARANVDRANQRLVPNYPLPTKEASAALVAPSEAIVRYTQTPQPRSKDGKFLPKRRMYLSKQEQQAVVTDENGVVMTQADLDAIYRDIWKD